MSHFHVSFTSCSLLKLDDTILSIISPSPSLVISTRYRLERGESYIIVSTIDPHSLDKEMVDEELMHDFAELWLRSDNESRILPSVTEDSYDNCPQSPHTEICDEDCGRKRRREPSFDVEELNSEDIHSWAAELGLAIEV